MSQDEKTRYKIGPLLLVPCTSTKTSFVNTRGEIREFRALGGTLSLVRAYEMSMQIKFNICFYSSQALVPSYVHQQCNVPPQPQNSLIAPSSKHVVYVHMSWLSCEFRLQHYHNNVLHLLVLSFSCKIHNKSNLSYKKGLG